MALSLGIRSHIFSFLPLQDLLDKICRLSARDRKNLIKTEILDQPRLLKLTIADLSINPNNNTTCTRYEKGRYTTFVQAAYQIDYQRLDYILKMLNGDLTIKIERYQDRDDFMLNTIYTLVRKLRKKKPIIFYEGCNKPRDQKINIQLIMGDSFETVPLASLFEKFSEDFLGAIQFDFQINKRVTGNRILKSFLMHSNKFTEIKINSYINFLDAESLETVDMSRFEKLSLSLYDNTNKLNGIISKFKNLKELEIKINKSPDILDLAHMQKLRFFKLFIEKNTSHVIQFSQGNISNEVQNLQGFNLQNIVLSDRGLQKMVIDVQEFQVMFQDMLPMVKDEKSPDLFKYFDWNVQEYVVMSNVIHQEVEAEMADNKEFLNMNPKIKLHDGREFQKTELKISKKSGMKFRIEYEEELNKCKMVFKTNSIQIKYV